MLVGICEAYCSLVGSMLSCWSALATADGCREASPERIVSRSMSQSPPVATWPSPSKSLGGLDSRQFPFPGARDRVPHRQSCHTVTRQM